MESRNVTVMFQKGGSGSVSTRIAVPKSWIDAMGITSDERSVTIKFDGEKIEVRKMRKFISFEELGGWMRDVDMNDILLFDENGEQHLDNNFVGFTRDGFGYCDPTTGEVTEVDFYNEQGDKIVYEWAKEACEVDYYFENPEQL